MTPVFLFDLGTASMLFAASTAFSSFGFVFCGVPILLILILSVSLATPTCRAFPLWIASESPMYPSQIGKPCPTWLAKRPAWLGTGTGCTRRCGIGSWPIWARGR
jgi:hypothetical protein